MRLRIPNIAHLLRGLVWRFRLELRRTGDPGHAERLAVKVVGAAMLAAAVYVVAQAARSLIVQARPGDSGAGLVVLAGSVVVLPVLGSIKLRLAKRLRSRALRGDGVLSAAARPAPGPGSPWRRLTAVGRCDGPGRFGGEVTGSGRCDSVAAWAGSWCGFGGQGLVQGRVDRQQGVHLH
jgi:hypothetical protein